MDAHHLNDYQKVEQLYSLPALGAQKPSEMLAGMLRLCPRGHEVSPFFTDGGRWAARRRKEWLLQSGISQA
jgi:hypothetical protein